MKLSRNQEINDRDVLSCSEAFLAFENNFEVQQKYNFKKLFIIKN